MAVFRMFYFNCFVFTCLIDFSTQAAVTKVTTTEDESQTTIKTENGGQQTSFTDTEGRADNALLPNFNVTNPVGSFGNLLSGNVGQEATLIFGSFQTLLMPASSVLQGAQSLTSGASALGNLIKPLLPNRD